MKWMRVREPVVVVPRQEPGLRLRMIPQILSRGTIVGVMKKRLPSVVTGRTDEIYVKWLDARGSVRMGWLPKIALLTRSTMSLLHVAGNREDMPTSWDLLRLRMFMQEGWPIDKWLEKFGSLNVPLLHAVIRELGGKVPRSDDPRLATRLVLNLIKPKRNTTMSKNRAEIEEQDEDETPTPRKTSKSKTAKKGAAKKSASKKAVKREGGPGRTSMYSGKRIVKLVKDNPRREDTHGYNSWELLRKGMTYEQYIEAGGRRVDLAWDILKGNVKLAKA